MLYNAIMQRDQDDGDDGNAWGKWSLGRTEHWGGAIQGWKNTRERKEHNKDEEAEKRFQEPRVVVVSGAGCEVGRKLGETEMN